MDHHILLIEDDINIQGYAKIVLDNAGHAVTAVATAAEARAAFHSNRFDLLIVDIGLPDANGLDLVRELRLGEIGVPFIFLTASQDLKTRLECFRLGAQDYIPKPFAVEELAARVQAHLRARKSREDLARRNYELELRHRARQDLTDMIVHDLKAPLTSIKGTIDLAMKYGLITEPAYQNLLTSAGTAANFMLFMLNDLLDLGQAEQVALVPELAPVDMAPLVDKLEALFHGQCHTRSVSLECQVSPEASRLKTDANLVFRILVNLVANALRHSPHGESVELDVAIERGQPRLTVADRGPGVPDQLKSRLFEKYATGAPRQGSGIGLAFCRLAAQALAGDIKVEDRPGGGSLFVVLLPAESVLTS